MHEYDEFDEERDLKKIKSEPHMTEFGDRMNKSDFCNGVLLLACIGAFVVCGCLRGCQELKKHTHKDNSAAAQTIHLSPHNCR